MTKEFTDRKRLLGLLFGIIAGLAFSITTWGTDAVQLALAHSATPFVKFLPGMAMSVAAGGVVGWLSIRFEKAKLAILLWLALAVFLSWLVLWLPLQLAPGLQKAFNPQATHFFHFSAIDGKTQIAAFVFLVVAFVSLVCGLLEVHLIDQAMISQGGMAILTPLLISLALFGFAGISADDLLNRNLREPIQALNDVIQFAVDNEGKEVSASLAREKRLSVVKEITGLVDRPRKLTVIGFDSSMWQIDILADFDGNLATCTVMVNQPTMCSLAGQ
ncbi:hypothetical protein LARV_00028 [Longilinea arvoryzae]|uniref:Uncharacterized protein n=1 Tax=Longilinea arvoryzae TaxID=360412 RepID=A0A0S7BE53_9CHLR|nr:hypothetical protein [Longilinea arvoryzae]GAP12296.1 hypothetical protein LARV_00028 [Longilinea arvoryzae]